MLKQSYWWTGTFNLVEMSHPHPSYPEMPYEYAEPTSFEQVGADEVAAVVFLAEARQLAIAQLHGLQFREERLRARCRSRARSP